LYGSWNFAIEWFLGGKILGIGPPNFVGKRKKTNQTK
jgi:hypothetical protein